MRFSAEADVLAGVAVTAVGVDALRQADEPGERALGALPVLVPLAVRAVEADEGRRQAMAWLGAAGAVLAAVYAVVACAPPCSCWSGSRAAHSRPCGAPGRQ